MSLRQRRRHRHSRRQKCSVLEPHRRWARVRGGRRACDAPSSVLMSRARLRLGLASDDRFLQSVIPFTSTAESKRLGVFGAGSSSTAKSPKKAESARPVPLAELALALAAVADERGRAVPAQLIPQQLAVVAARHRLRRAHVHADHALPRRHGWLSDPRIKSSVRATPV